MTPMPPSLLLLLLASIASAQLPPSVLLRGPQLLAHHLDGEDGPTKLGSCDLSARQRLKIQASALHDLKKRGWERVASGLFVNLVDAPDDVVIGNPNTIYGMTIFNDSDHKLTPKDYPPLDFLDFNGSQPPTQHFGYTLSHDEAIVLFMCMPPPAKYVGITAYITGRMMVNDTDPQGDGRLYGHMPLAEVTDPFNYLKLNTTSGTAQERGEDVSSFFGSVALMVFTPSRKVFEDIAEAYVGAGGLDPRAVNMYPLSSQVVRLHNREESLTHDFPDLVSVVSRISYFEDQQAGHDWATQVHPALILRAPSMDRSHGYQLSVPDPLLTNDVTGDSEVHLQPTIDALIQAIIDDQENSLSNRLLRHEQLNAVPNDKSIRTKCLNNVTYTPIPNPFSDKVGSCGFGTRDARYGASHALDLSFGEDLFFVVVGVKHEALKHAAYASLMLTSKEHCELKDHTITFRESQGNGLPEQYLPNTPDADQLWALKLARDCAEDDLFCLPFTHSQFASTDTVLWLERAYLHQASGVAPNIDEYIMSHVLVFQGQA